MASPPREFDGSGRAGLLPLHIEEAMLQNAALEHDEPLSPDSATHKSRERQTRKKKAKGRERKHPSKTPLLPDTSSGRFKTNSTGDDDEESFSSRPPSRTSLAYPVSTYSNNTIGDVDYDNDLQPLGRSPLSQRIMDDDVPLAIAQSVRRKPYSGNTSSIMSPVQSPLKHQYRQFLSPPSSSLPLYSGPVQGHLEPVEDEHPRLRMPGGPSNSTLEKLSRRLPSHLFSNSPNDPESLHNVNRKKSLTRPERRRDKYGSIISSGEIPFANNHDTFRSPLPITDPRSATPNRLSVPTLLSISQSQTSLPRGFADYKRPRTACRRIWVLFSRCVTFYALPPLLTCCGLRTPEVQLAWREKLALCILILLTTGLVGFFTFGLRYVLCNDMTPRMSAFNLTSGNVIVNGFALQMGNYPHEYEKMGKLPFENLYAADAPLEDRELSYFFQNTFVNLPGCKTMFGDGYIGDNDLMYYCTVHGKNPQKAMKLGNYPAEYCHRNADLISKDITQMTNRGERTETYVDWETVHNPQNSLLVVNGRVIDFSRLALLKKPIANLNNVNGIDLDYIFRTYRNRDASRFLSGNDTMRDIGRCLSKIALVGELDTVSTGCITSDIITSLSLSVIALLILIRFFMALLFSWCLSRRLGARLSPTERRYYLKQAKRLHESRIPEQSSIGGRDGVGKRGSPYVDNPLYSSHNLSVYGMNGASSNSMIGSPCGITSRPSIESMLTRPDNMSDKPLSERNTSGLLNYDSNSHLFTDTDDVDIAKHEVMHTICLVTCYSEDVTGIKASLDSLAATTYLDSHKLLFVVADGLIRGSGNTQTTPEIIVSLMEKDPSFPEVPKPYSYVAIAEGARRHNMAQVHAGYYYYDDRRVPMIVIVKCGTPEEQSSPKPGNRGKRDSQIVLMSFLQKVMFDDRMTPMEYDLFQKIREVTHVNPDKYEMVMMVDADTIVYRDSLERMVACFIRDPTVMGLCGETTISNKWSSPIAMVQVFEYYISHHLAKAFESVFGGVTCLPGCFCAYRIKTPKGRDGYWVPIIANPDIVEEYSENVIDTLHKKNLYLLGEDRYLTTLMLRTFPKRKMMFVPQAKCQTVVPDSFSVLLSQRRRWINSTIHNLFELVLVKDLCGTFCFSMQFVIFMELIGTVVLPAAMVFTIYLIAISIVGPVLPFIPLVLLAVVLGLPLVLIVLTTRQIGHVFWMLIYLLSLLMWNAILPLYAYWHFDDFSWGATRQVEGLKIDAHSTDDGEFDSSKIVMNRYAEWELIKRRAIVQAQNIPQPQSNMGWHQETSYNYYGVPNTILLDGVMSEFDGQAIENNPTLTPMMVSSEHVI